MAQLINAYIKGDKLKEVLSVLDKKGEQGIALTISVNDEARNYGQNVNIMIAQSKEDREAKKDKYYLGNGKTFWSNNNEFIPPKEEAQSSQVELRSQSQEDDLPF